MLGSVLFAQDNITQKINLAESYYNSGKLEKAKDLYTDLLKIQPWNNAFTNSLNTIYLRLKEYDNSIFLLKEKIENYPTNITFYGLLGTTYHTMGLADSALIVWNKGIKTNPSLEVSYRIISNNMIQNRLYNEAIEILRGAQKVAKNPNQYPLEIANLLSVTMKYTEAAEEYCKLLIQNPSQLNLIKTRMRTYLTRLSATEETIEAVEDFLDNTNSEYVEQLLAFLYSYNNDYDKAFNIITDLDKRTSGEGLRVFQFAQEAFSANDYEAAGRAYKFLLDNYGQSQYISVAEMGYSRSQLNKLQAKYVDKNDWKPLKITDTTNSSDYVELIEILKKMTKPNYLSHIVTESRYYIGTIYKNKFLNYEEALLQFNYVIENYPNSQFAFLSLFERGELFIINDDLESAKKDFLRIGQITGVPWAVKSKTLLKRANLEFWSGNFEKAISLLGQITTDYKDNAVNDAIQLALLINTAKTDSLSAAKYAKAQLSINQFNLAKASGILEDLATNSDHFLIKEVSRFNLTEVLIAQNNFSEAISLLREISESENFSLYSDKALFLIAETYNYGLNDKTSAIAAYENLLATYPKSIYLSKSRDAIIDITMNEGENL